MLRTVEAGGLVLYPTRREVHTNRGRHHLTIKECRLLRLLMRHPGQTLTRQFLVREVWETDWMGDTRTLDVHMCWLRKKVEQDPHHPQLIRTVRGVGYQFM